MAARRTSRMTFHLALRALLLALLWLALSSADSASAASVTVTPASAAPGATVALRGDGFAARARGRVQLGARGLRSVRSARRGTVSVSVRVPRSARRGVRSLALRVGRRTVRVPFQVVRRTPAVVSSLTVSGRGERVFLPRVAGARVTLQGAAFRRSARVRVSLAGAFRRSLRAGRRGTFSLSVALPARLAGARRIVVTGPGGRMSIPFRVTAPGATGGPDGAPTACATSSAALARPPAAAATSASSIRVNLPHRLDFGRDHAGVRDGAGVGTGFTRVEAVPGRAGSLPAQVAVERSAGTLALSTTAGSTSGATHWFDNALGVGVDAPSNLSLVQATLLGPCASGAGEEAGLFFGENQRDQVRLGAVSTSSGHEARVRHGGATGSSSRARRRRRSTCAARGSRSPSRRTRPTARSRPPTASTAARRAASAR